jgi:DNA-binding SARP family transcriptional activator
MSRIRIQLFGRFCVRREEQVVAGFEAHKTQELFCYLLLHRDKPVFREHLASVLWPDTTTPQSKKKLRQALWHLQSALGTQNEPVHDRLLWVEPERVQMNAEADFWLDIVPFEKTFDLVQSIPGQDLNTGQVQALQEAVQLYQGPLLEDCYEDWCLNERERLQNMYLAMLNKLMGYYEAHHDYEPALLYGARILSYDKAHERTHFRLMRLHYLNGNRAAAIRQYEQCAAALEEELGVKPSKRTTALYKRILADQLIEPEQGFTRIEPAKTQPVAETSPPLLLESLAHLAQLQEFLADLQNQVQQSIQNVQHALGNTPDSLNPFQPKSDKEETLLRRLGDTARR